MLLTPWPRTCQTKDRSFQLANYELGWVLEQLQVAMVLIVRDLAACRTVFGFELFVADTKFVSAVTHQHA